MRLGKALRVIVIVSCLLAGFAAIVFTLVREMSLFVEGPFYASPTGSGSKCSYEAPCSLTGVRDKVRSVNANMRGDIIVYLRGGTYALLSPLELTSQDSGTNRHNIVYKAYENEEPVISGGKRVSGWSLHDGANDVYKASVGRSLRTRQLYVDGVRATRARGEKNPSGFVKTPSGYETTDTTMQAWDNIGDIEFVGFAQWLSYRCGVSSISGATITMKEPCWSNTQRESVPERWRMGAPEWIENAYELLDEPGEWYLDHSTGYLYYRPHPGEDMATATVIVPRLERLVEGKGTLDDPIHNIRFCGLTFSYATWLAPSTNEGYAAGQAGFRSVGPMGSRKQEKPLAHVTFSTAKSIRFERNTFEHMGAVGLSFDHGSQHNAIVGNKLHDISGGGVYLGNIQNHHPSDTRVIVKDNVVENNYITRIGAEYFDQVGIWAGYTDGSVIEHNELYDLPYSAISVGWGWGCVDPGGDCSWLEDKYTTPTIAQDNKIRYNLVHDYVKVLRDGGGIYTLGAQPHSEIAHNFVHDQENIYAALYLDKGTQHYIVENNVVFSAPQWLRIWTDSIKNNAVRYNYTDTPDLTNEGTNNVVSNNTLITHGNWPDEARNVMLSAGIEDNYQDIK
jgi:hypothetical protein